ncbi:hypothetical protein K490DRAFT_53860 [Saccharata proteae CBS 121410]|uniref:Uncharacterized protein n=1 Tax=Saccharata proteae CBS 121410 TaxID=1314787 RepID=A0A9P4LZ37_9PEZI|nr:hypothetical protein K490DRAFT_53860 [Saccharata proteae CBS 121410]
MPEVAARNENDVQDVLDENLPFVSEADTRSFPKISHQLAKSNIHTQDSYMTNNTSRAADQSTTVQLTSSTGPITPLFQFVRSLSKPFIGFFSEPSTPQDKLYDPADCETYVGMNMSSLIADMPPGNRPLYTTFRERAALQAQDPERAWLVARVAEHPPQRFGRNGSFRMTTQQARIAAQRLFAYDEQHWPDAHLSVEREATAAEAEHGSEAVDPPVVHEVPETECMLDPHCETYWWRGGNAAMAQLRRWEDVEEPSADQSGGPDGWDSKGE